MFEKHLVKKILERQSPQLTEGEVDVRKESEFSQGELVITI